MHLTQHTGEKSSSLLSRYDTHSFDIESSVEPPTIVQFLDHGVSLPVHTERCSQPLTNMFCMWRASNLPPLVLRTTRESVKDRQRSCSVSAELHLPLALMAVGRRKETWRPCRLPEPTILNRAMWIHERYKDEATAVFELFVYAQQFGAFELAEQVQEAHFIKF